MNSRRGYLAPLGIAGCLILVGTCWVSGQQGRPRYAYQPQADMPSSEFCADSRLETHGPQASTHVMPGQRSTALIGSRVKLADGELLGRVEDLMINESGCVDFMIVSFNGSSEFGGRLAAIPWDVGTMDFGSRMVVLNVERGTLREAPIFFTRGRAWPNLYEPQWAATVHNYFGVESDIEQRIERAYGTPESREPEPGDREGRRPSREMQRREMQAPHDKHLDAAPQPTPTPDALDIPDRELNRNGDLAPRRDRATQERDSILNDDDNGRAPADSFKNGDKPTPKKSERDKEGTSDRDSQEQSGEDEAPPPPE